MKRGQVGSVLVVSKAFILTEYYFRLEKSQWFWVLPPFLQSKRSCDHRTLRYKCQKLDSQSIRITMITAEMFLARNEGGFPCDWTEHLTLHLKYLLWKSVLGDVRDDSKSCPLPPVWDPDFYAELWVLKSVHQGSYFADEQLSLKNYYTF